MIKITDVAGNEKYINCDLIEKVELIPDTLLVLINGHNFIIKDSPDEIVERIVEFKKRCNLSLNKSFNIELIDRSNKETNKDEDSKIDTKE